MHYVIENADHSDIAVTHSLLIYFQSSSCHFRLKMYTTRYDLNWRQSSV